MKAGKRYWLTFLLLSLLAVNQLWAFDQKQQRINSIGLKLFRSLLASELDIDCKISADRQMSILFIYAREQAMAKQLADDFLKIGKQTKQGRIHQIPVSVTAVSADDLVMATQQHVAGAFIVDQMTERQLVKVINYARSKRIVVFSPYPGDVQAGVAAGLDIGVKVRPFLNMRALQASGLNIKKLFIKVSKRYED